MAPMQVLLSAVSGFERGEIALERIKTLERNLTTLHPELDSLTEVDSKREFKRLDLRDVTHVYHRETEMHDFIVGPVNLALFPGEVVFLVGGNGMVRRLWPNFLLVSIYRKMGRYIWTAKSLQIQIEKIIASVFLLCSLIFTFSTGWSGPRTCSTRRACPELSCPA